MSSLLAECAVQQATDRTWTAYENHLAVEHQRKINRPPLPQQEPRQRPPDEVLYSHHLLIQDASRHLQTRSRYSPYLDLQNRLRLLIDGPTGLGAKDCLSLADHLHRGAFMAVKIKGLKALRGVGPAGCRGKILEFIGREVRSRKLVGFAGHPGRLYVLLPRPWDGELLAHGLADLLERLLDGMGLSDLKDPPKPRCLVGIGRTWEEAHLITRGRIRQTDVPIDLGPPADDSAFQAKR